VNGSNGQNAYTETNGDFVVPVALSNVTFSVLNSDWMIAGQVIVAGDGPAHFEVVSKPSSTSVTATYLDYAGDIGAGATISSGSGVSPAGIKGVFAGGLPTALTDNIVDSIASNIIADGVGKYVLAFPIQLAAMTASAADLMTDYVPGHRFKILSVDFVTTTIGAGAGASQILNLEIGSTNVTGGVVTATLASTNTLGEITTGTNVTANNIGSATDAISIEVANAGTIFTAGAGMLLIGVQNLDTADAISSLADHVNDLIAGLT
jgi:hypothetical protein